MALKNITLNNSQVRALLNSPEMRAATQRAGEDIAARVRSAGSPTYGSLQVTVTTQPNGGVKGDRAQTDVVVAPPAPGEVRFPDVAGRFGVLVQVAREVTRR